MLKTFIFTGDDFDTQQPETALDNDTTEIHVLDETLKYNDNESDLQNLPEDDRNSVSEDNIIKNIESHSDSDSESKIQII